jgi:hypothetical protein
MEHFTSQSQRARLTHFVKHPAIPLVSGCASVPHVTLEVHTPRVVRTAREQHAMSALTAAVQSRLTWVCDHLYDAGDPTPPPLLGKLHIRLWVNATCKRFPASAGTPFTQSELNSGCCTVSHHAHLGGSGGDVHLDIWRVDELGRVVFHELIHAIHPMFHTTSTHENEAATEVRAVRFEIAHGATSKKHARQLMRVERKWSRSTSDAVAMYDAGTTNSRAYVVRRAELMFRHKPRTGRRYGWVARAQAAGQLPWNGHGSQLRFCAPAVGALSPDISALYTAP